MEKYEGYYVRIILHSDHLQLKEGFVLKNSFHRERTIPYSDLSDAYVTGRLFKKLYLKTKVGEVIECDFGRKKSVACQQAIQARMFASRKDH
jgi:hypothetical protein